MVGARQLGFLAAGVAAVGLLGSGTFAQAPAAQPAAPGPWAKVAPVNDLPNPYTTVEGWAKLPEGRTWGSTSAVDIDKDGRSIWVFQSNRMLGGVCYVDLFAGDLEGIKSKIPYFKELGLTYLHLMPLFKAPEGENDGGYAVSSYRKIHPPLGTMEQLASLARELRSAGISLVVDLVFNHTSDEHVWAERAKRGEEEYQEFYRIFKNREMPDAYERTLREIFPDEHPGAFTFFPDLFKEGGWVWTTFHSYQGDLNYANPVEKMNENLPLPHRGVPVGDRPCSLLSKDRRSNA